MSFGWNEEPQPRNTRRQKLRKEAPRVMGDTCINDEVVIDGTRWRVMSICKDGWVFCRCGKSHAYFRHEAVIDDVVYMVS